jgi:hypothetical protein
MTSNHSRIDATHERVAYRGAQKTAARVISSTTVVDVLNMRFDGHRSMDSGQS